MDQLDTRKAESAGESTGWPPWLRVVATIAIVSHAALIWIAAWGGSPASRLEMSWRDGFRWYYGLIDQGYTYRYYAPEPPPTPVLRAVIKYKDGKTEEVRIPNRDIQPRMLYQRQLALANHLLNDVEAARAGTGDASRSRWAQSYAKHLGKTHPGAVSVALSVEMHLIPDPNEIRRQIDATGKAPDLDDPNQFYSVPERIGEFPCDVS